MKFLGQVAKFLFYLLFTKNKLPDYFEQLDDWLTNVCTREQRDRFVRRINGLFDLWIIREPLEFFLNRATKGERIDLNVETYHARQQRQLPEGESRIKWSNWIGTYWAEPLAFKVPGKGPYKNVVEQKDQLKDYDFETLHELQELVKETEKEGLKIKCVASGHAISDIAKTNDIQISTKRFTIPQRRATDLIKDAYKDGYKGQIRINGEDLKEDRFLFETGAGTLVVDLNAMLEKEGLALLNQGGSDVQGFFGGVSTSTHGSGINIGPYPAFVKSFVMIASNGAAYRLEPSDGITDPDKYDQSDDWLIHKIKLVQKDEEFYAALVNMGCMGIVYSAIIEVRSPYRLFEERRMWDWDELKKEMEKMGIKEYAEQHRHMEISVNPYRLNSEGKIDPKGSRKCLVMTKNYTNSTDDTSGNKKGAKYQRNFFSSFISGISIAGTISTWLFNRKPENMPKMINNSITRLVDHKGNGEGFLGKSYEVLNQGLRELKFFGFAVELSFPVEKAFAAIDHMFVLAEKAAEKDQFHCAPISIRFVDECPAYLSMMNGRKTITTEIVSVKGVTGGIDVLERIESEMDQFDGRPHWGLYLTHLNGTRLQQLYPTSFSKWKKAYDKYNKSGVFCNDFTDRMGWGP